MLAREPGKRPVDNEVRLEMDVALKHRSSLP
jgi:hypothetical protein